MTVCDADRVAIDDCVCVMLIGWVQWLLQIIDDCVCVVLTGLVQWLLQISDDCVCGADRAGSVVATDQ